MIIRYRSLASLVHSIERNLVRTESFEFILSAKKDRPLIFCFLFAYLNFIFSDLVSWILFSYDFLKRLFNCLVLSATNLMSKVIAHIFCHHKFWTVFCVGPGHFKNHLVTRIYLRIFWKEWLSFIDIVSPRNRNLVLNSSIDEKRRTIVFFRRLLISNLDYFSRSDFEFVWIESGHQLHSN